jgi:hypothetical protein
MFHGQKNTMQGSRLMPKYGAVSLADVAASGQSHLEVICEPCGRSGRYSVAGLIAAHGPEAGLPDLLAYLTRTCDRQQAPGARRCHAVYGAITSKAL